MLDRFRPQDVAARAGLTSEIVGGDPAEFIRELARKFATGGPSIAIAGGSAGAQSNGLFNVEEAAMFLNLAGRQRRLDGRSGP